MATIQKTALIIGAGTGGYPCAIRLGQLGIDTMLDRMEAVFRTALAARKAIRAS